MAAIQSKDFYDKISEMQKEEQKLRHEQRNNFQILISTMEEKFEKRFDKLETLISEGFDKADSKFATKVEHSYNSTRIDKIESNIWKVVWTIILWVMCIVWGAVFVVIMLFWERF